MSMRMIKCVAVLFLVFTGTLPVLAQDFRQDVTALQKEFENMTSVHVVMDIKAFGTVNEARPYFQTHVDIRKQDNRYRYLYGDLEMLMNDNYLIVVNKSERQISMTKRDVKSEAAIAKSMHFNLDSMITTIGTVQGDVFVHTRLMLSSPARRGVRAAGAFRAVSRYRQATHHAGRRDRSDSLQRPRVRQRHPDRCDHAPTAVLQRRDRGDRGDGAKSHGFQGCAEHARGAAEALHGATRPSTMNWNCTGWTARAAMVCWIISTF